MILWTQDSSSTNLLPFQLLVCSRFYTNLFRAGGGAGEGEAAAVGFTSGA